MNGLPYYKAYPRDFFEGTIGMPFELKSAYRLILDLIYMHGGRLADDPRFISGHLGCSVRAWNGYRSELLKTGKIRADLGIISNFRADKELESLSSFQEKQRENRSRPNKNNDLSNTMVSPKVNHTDTDTDKERKEVAAAARDAQPFDQTDRERLLTAMGADPVSGLIGPNGTRLGTMADMAEAAKWSELGLSTVDQCRLIAERLDQARRKSPNFSPRSFAYFSGMMSDFAVSRSAPVPSGSVTPAADDRSAKRARWQRIAAGK